MDGPLELQSSSDAEVQSGDVLLQRHPPLRGVRGGKWNEEQLLVGPHGIGGGRPVHDSPVRRHLEQLDVTPRRQVEERARQRIAL